MTRPEVRACPGRGLGRAAVALKLTLALACVGLPGSWLAWTAEPQAPGNLPTADAVLDRWIEAAGGRQALERLKTRVMKGEIQVAALGASGPFEVRMKAPNKQVSAMEVPGVGTIREGFDGTVAWSSAPFLGARTKTGGDLERVRRTTGFPRELRIREAYSRFEVVGSADVNGSEAWVVEAFPKAGKSDKLYFDKKSGLLTREETTVSAALVGELTFRSDYGDFRTVDGVKAPFEMRLPEPAELGFSIKFTEVKHNTPIDDSVFNRP